MKKAKVLFGLIVVAMLLGNSSPSFADNSPNSGSGGNGGNNGNGNTVWIYHTHGNGTISMMQIPAGAIAGHAAHGDMWFPNGCPLTGPASCY
jgi:hypothetical protein